MTEGKKEVELAKSAFVSLEPGVLLKNGTYRIKATLGQGGFGITYLAEHVAMRRDVCIKEFYLKQYSTRRGTSRNVDVSAPNFETLHASLKDKFLKEAHVLGAMNHPNIVQVHDLFTENNTAYYVMEFIEGESLWNIIERDGAIAETEARGYIRQIVSALGYIHSRNMLHLDVKPQNIMIRRSDNAAILIDFGLTKHYDSTDGGQTTATVSGHSDGYASIEQYDNRGVTHFMPEIDIYSLGATFYAMLTASRPPHTSDVRIMEQFPEPSWPMSKGARRAINRAMQFDIHKRPHSAEEFVALLDEPRVSVGSKSHGRTFVAIAVAVIVIAVAVIAAITISEDDTTTSEISTAMLIANADAQLEAGNTESAFDMMLQAAERGDVVAAERVAEFYVGGVGVEEDYDAAIVWYERAAEQGSERSCNVLGDHYYTGDIVEKDIAKAIKWYGRSAEQGNVTAEYNLGVCYMSNSPMQSLDSAIDWFTRAAEHGHAKAQYRLGTIYLSTNPAVTNYELAVEWLQRAAESGSPDAEYALGRYYYREQEYDTAREWYEQAAEHGLTAAQYDLGVYYERLEDSDENDAAALRWYCAAADAGDSRALFRVGVFYEYGMGGVDENRDEAVRYYREAAEGGHAPASARLQELGVSE